MLSETFVEELFMRSMISNYLDDLRICTYNGREQTLNQDMSSRSAMLMFIELNKGASSLLQL